MTTINAKFKKHYMMTHHEIQYEITKEEQKKNIELARDHLEKEGIAE